ncbi:MAG: hypothetical protein HQL40_04635 [Alphaproteobacteria bacterium]|nr:hypothetical protein [Alphaproteobacteria bacterium]
MTTGSRRPIGPSDLVVAFGAAVVLLIVGIFSWMAHDSREAMLAFQADTNDKLAESLEQHIDGNFDLAAQTLAMLRDLVSGRDGAPPNPDALRPFLETMVGGSPAVAGIRHLDAQGMPLLSHPDVPAAGVGAADRDYFIAARDGETGVNLGSPIVSRVTGTWVLPMSLRVERPDGAFAGVVSLVLDIRAIVELYESVRAKPNGAVGLFRLSDGMALARAPFVPEMLGKTYANGPLFENLKRAPRGRYLQVVATDGKMRQSSYRAIAKHGVVIGIASSYDDVMAQWRSVALVHLGLGALLAAMAAAATFLLRREIVARERDARLLASRAEDIEHANEELREMARLAAHHLQEPLRHILSYAQLLARRFAREDDDEARDYVRYLEGGVARMKGQLTEVQRYLAIEQGDGSQPVCLDAALDAALARLDDPVEIERQPLPTVRGDRRLIEQLFVHLFESLGRHGAPRGFGIQAGRDPAGWRVTLLSRALAVDPLDPTRLFGVFVHGADGSQPAPGLALCRKIVRLHGGRMWIEPAQGGGTMLHFLLPG